MHGPLEPPTDEKPALQPNAAIGPALRAVAGNILAKARVALTDPERSNQDAVHDFRRAMKQWRALMRLLEPFIPDADRWRREARDHARSLAHARDGAAALNAFDGLGDKGILLLSERSNATVRTRIEALRGNEEQAVLTPALRDTILAWLDAATAAIELWPLDPFDFSAIAAQLADSYRSARRRIPADWDAAEAADLHALRQRSSTCAIRWNWSSRYGRASAGCGPRRQSGCANGSAAARTSKCSSGSRHRISRWRAGVRG
jgi:hypothetical protein